MSALVVTNPFGGREKGSKITDPSEIAAVLAGENAQNVVQVQHAGEPTKKKEA
jgi:hypothetical protein